MKDKMERREAGEERKPRRKETKIGRERERARALFKSYLSSFQPVTHVLLKGAPQTPVGSWTGTGGRFA